VLNGNIPDSNIRGKEHTAEGNHGQPAPQVKFQVAGPERDRKQKRTGNRHPVKSRSKRRGERHADNHRKDGNTKNAQEEGEPRFGHDGCFK